MTQLKTIRAVCPHDCPDTCAMLVTVDGDTATRVRGNPDHEFTRGFLCHKVSRYLERVYHPDRLKYPLRRTGPKGSSRFERISWDEALDAIVEQFQRVSNGPHGPQAILPYSFSGTLGKVQGEGLDRRFFHRLGASKLKRTICSAAGMTGYAYTIGMAQGTDPEAVSDSRYIVNWGSNTAVTNMHLWVKMVDARKRGARIVSIDPYRCRTAERSDWHIMPKVGTDAALALGLMHVLFRDGLADEDYLSDHCVGADELRERVMSEYGLDHVSRITGLQASTIEQLATELATIRPSVIRVNYGMQRHRGGGMAIRTVACLPAVLGSWRQRAGGLLLSTSGTFPLDMNGLQRPDLSPPGTRTVNMVQLAEALAGELPGPPIEMLFVFGSNPAAVAPNQTKVLAGLCREDLFTVVHEQFPTDTVDYADIVLPATTQLEQFDIHASYGHQWLQANQPAIPVCGEACSNSDLFRRLAKRMGFEAELFEVSDQDLARTLLWESQSEDDRPAELRGITVDRLISEGPQKLRMDPDAPPFADGGFRTPSGKCELYCQRMQDEGLDPLPTYTPPVESVDSSPELAKKYPLHLLSPPSPHFVNTTFGNMESLRRAARTPELQIHPDDAAARGIAEGAKVSIVNDRGVFGATARVTDGIRPGVVVAPSIWWNKHAGGSNANATTPSRLTDMGEGAVFFDNLVEVRTT